MVQLMRRCLLRLQHAMAQLVLVLMFLTWHLIIFIVSESEAGTVLLCYDTAVVARFEGALEQCKSVKCCSEVTQHTCGKCG